MVVCSTWCATPMPLLGSSGRPTRDLRVVLHRCTRSARKVPRFIEFLRFCPDSGTVRRVAGNVQGRRTTARAELPGGRAARRKRDSRCSAADAQGAYRGFRVSSSSARKDRRKPKYRKVTYSLPERMPCIILFTRHLQIHRGSGEQTYERNGD